MTVQGRPPHVRSFPHNPRVAFPQELRLGTAPRDTLPASAQHPLRALSITEYHAWHHGFARTRHHRRQAVSIRNNIAFLDWYFTSPAQSSVFEARITRCIRRIDYYINMLQIKVFSDCLLEKGMLKNKKNYITIHNILNSILFFVWYGCVVLNETLLNKRSSI